MICPPDNAVGSLAYAFDLSHIHSKLQIQKPTANGAKIDKIMIAPHIALIAKSNVSFPSALNVCIELQYSASRVACDSVRLTGDMFLMSVLDG